MSRSRASAKAAGTRTTSRPLAISPEESEQLAERLWTRIRKVDSGCWEWAGYRMPKGYGQMGRADGSRRLALTHRVAWELANGPIPVGLVVRHRCDNPPCCNPEHLELGSVADNSRDAKERGQLARGSRLPHTVLSRDQVIEIRSRYRRFSVPGFRGYRSNRDELAAEYGVSGKYIVAIAGRQERADV